MSGEWLRPGHVAAAALLIGGMLVAVLPQHALSIARLVVVTMAAAAALHALALNAPPRWWRSPFAGHRRNRRRASTADDIDWIRSMLAAPRQRVRHGPSLPPETLGVLQPLIRSALERHGIDAADTRGRAAARTLLAPVSWAVLTGEPVKGGQWYRLLPPDERATARVVHGVLDDLERLAADRAGIPDS
jgi:hypothetical protein